LALLWLTAGRMPCWFRVAVAGVLLLPLPEALAETAAAADAPDNIWQRKTLTGSWNGVRTSLENAGITLNLQEQEEVWGNVSGGRRRGTAYDGLTTATVKLDLGALVGWKNATFFASAYQIHGSGPTKNLT